ncbi:MAG: alanine racemase, partial [Mailhella sp.]|nr:alanine racemase [Mailhella sp.]
MRSLCRVHLNWDSFRSNLRLLRYISPDLMPVIKADAYGHGARRAARELETEGVGWAAAGTLEEAEAIRDGGFSGRIVILLSCLRGAGDVDRCMRSGLL